VSRPPVEARRATAADLDDLVLLWTHAREELGRSGRLPSVVPLEQFRARLTEVLAGTDSIVLIGRHEGAPAGYAVLRLAPVLLAEGDALHIEQVFVLPSMRRRGVARALLVVATSIAERQGADQVLAGAPPSAREAHRFLARLGFSPLMVRRVVGTSALRRRLAGESPRRGLEDLLSRRRSLRARSLRAGWGGTSSEAGAGAVDGATGDAATPPSTGPALIEIEDPTAPRQIDLSEPVEAAGSALASGAPESPQPDAVSPSTSPASRKHGRQRA
jgi:ribosomal protein S18 acetylase RimI-like enzyme